MSTAANFDVTSWTQQSSSPIFDGAYTDSVRGGAADFYVSKDGSDAFDGLTLETAKLTLAAGIALITPDSNEVLEIEGGSISSPDVYTGGHLIPSGCTIQAIPGTVVIRDGNGANSSVITSTGNNISLFGLVIDGAASVTNFGVKLLTCGGTNATIQQCGFEGVPTATAHHEHFWPMGMGGTGHLLEDCWLFGEGRYLINVQGASDCVIRNCIGRHDGTQVDIGEPHATFSHYNNDNIIWENNISLDYNEPDSVQNEGGCFKMSSNSNGSNQDTQWLGNISCFRDPATSNNRGLHFDAKTGTTVANITVTDFYAHFTDANGAGIIYTGLYTGNMTVTNYTREDGSNDGSATADGLCDIDAYYVDGVKQVTSKWDTHKNLDVIWARMQAYDDAGDGRRGWTDNETRPNLENYVKGI